MTPTKLERLNGSKSDARRVTQQSDCPSVNSASVGLSSFLVIYTLRSTGSDLYLSLNNQYGLYATFLTAIAEVKRYPGLPKDSLISRLTLRFASRQNALRMNAQKRLSLADNSDLA